MKKNMKKYLSMALAAVICIAAAGTAFADVAFTTVDNNYASGAMGIISKNTSGDLATTPDVVTGLNGDQAIFSFRNTEGKARVMISQYTYGQPDTVWIYDPAGSWTTPIEVQWANFSNKRAIATLGSNLYAMSYDDANIVKVDMTDEKYSQTAYIHYTAKNSDYVSAGEDLVAAGDYLYGIFSERKGNYSNYEYNPGVILKLDKDLNIVASADIGKNATKMAVFNDKIYVTSIGGKQNYGSFNTDSKVEMVDTSTMEVTELLKGTDMSAQYPGWAFDFHDIVFSDTDAFILAGAYDNSGFTFESRIFKVSVADLNAKKLGNEFADSSNMGWTWGLDYDHVANQLMCFAGFQLNFYNPDDANDMQVVDSMTAKGNLYSATAILESIIPPVPPTPTPTPTPTGSSGGGCNGGFAALALVAVLPLIKKRGKK